MDKPDYFSQPWLSKTAIIFLESLPNNNSKEISLTPLEKNMKYLVLLRGLRLLARGLNPWLVLELTKA
jgi:hypothetical protein